MSLSKVVVEASNQADSSQHASQQIQTVNLSGERDNIMM